MRARNRRSVQLANLFHCELRAGSVPQVVFVFILLLPTLQLGACSPSACKDMAAEGGLRLIDRVHPSVEPAIRDITGPTDFMLWTKEAVPEEVSVTILPGAAHESLECSKAQKSIAGKVALACFRVVRSGEVRIQLDARVKCPSTIWNKSVSSSTAPRVFRFTLSGAERP